MFESSSFGRSYGIWPLDWTRPIYTLPNNWHVGTGQCPVGSWVSYHGKQRWSYWAQLWAGTLDRVIQLFHDTCRSVTCDLCHQTTNSSLLLSIKSHLIHAPFHIFSFKQQIMVDHFLPCYHRGLHCFVQSLSFVAPDSPPIGWRPDLRCFGQCKRRQMPSLTSYQRRGGKMFTGTPSRDFWVESDQWCSKGRFSTVQYSIWHLSTADGTLKAVSLLLWSVFLTPTADKRIHPLFLLLKFLLSFAGEGFEFLAHLTSGSKSRGYLHVKAFSATSFCQPGLHKWDLSDWLIDR